MGWQTFSVKGQTVGTSGSVGPGLPVAATSLYLCHAKSTTDHMDKDAPGCAPVKLWTLKLELQTIFKCHRIAFFF